VSDIQPPSVNPYVAGPPVSGAHFFGREALFQDIQEALVAARPGPVVLSGQRRMGKSSILKELRGRLAPEQFAVVDFDLQFHAGKQPEVVLRTLAEAVAGALDFDLPADIRFDPDEPTFERELPPRVEEHLGAHQRLLILMDEFGSLPATNSKRVPAATRELAGLLGRLLASQAWCLVLVTGGNLAALPGAMQSLIGRGTRLEVGFLAEEEAERLVRQPAAEWLRYSGPALGAILDQTNGHPYFTQLLCMEIFNRAAATQNRGVGVAEVEAAAWRCLISGMGACSWLWNELEPAERVYLAAVAATARQEGVRGVAEEQIQACLEEYGIRLLGMDLPHAGPGLVKRKWLERAEPGQYRITVELMQRWIEKEHPLDDTKLDVEGVNPVAHMQYEAGRKAHASGELMQAISHYQVAIRMNPNHVRAQMGLAQALYEMGDWERAVVEFGLADYLDEGIARAGLVAALLAYGRWLEKENRDGALEIYRRVFEYAPGNSQAEARIAQLGRRRWMQRAIPLFGPG
jgi:hypothetical protein